jgi:hypothetical protein
MLAPAELSLTPAPDATPPLTRRQARRDAVLALTRRFHRRPKHARVSCRPLRRGSVRCSARWKAGRFAYRGKLRIFTTREATGSFERRFDLRIRRTDTLCAAAGGSRCSRTVKATNLRVRHGPSRP